MAGPPRPSFPSAPSEPGLRRLGVRAQSTTERPLRAQTVLLVLGAVTLLSLPIYLMRKPEKAPEPQAEQKAPSGFVPLVPAAPPSLGESDGIAFGEVQRLACSAHLGAASQAGPACDPLPYFEAALKKAIVDTASCAPRPTEEGSTGTINFVLKVDFNQKNLHVFPGASGSLKGPNVRHAARCVKQALPSPDWDKLETRFRYYELAMMATYKPPKPSSTPSFE